MKVKSESEVAESCPTLSDPMDCSLPDSSILEGSSGFLFRIISSLAASHVFLLYGRFSAVASYTPLIFFFFFFGSQQAIDI